MKHGTRFKETYRIASEVGAPMAESTPDAVSTGDMFTPDLNAYTYVLR